MGSDGVVGLTIRFGSQLGCTGQLPDGVGEVVAVQAGGREHHVHARAAQLFTRHELHVDDATAFIPDGFHAHQPQGLGFQQALVAHGLHRPQRHGQLGRCPAMLLAVGGDEFLGGLLAGFPGVAGGHAGRVKAIEVATGGQGIGVAHRISPVGGGTVASLQGSDEPPGLAAGIQRLPPLARLGEMRLQGLGQLAQIGVRLQVALEQPVGRGVDHLLVVDGQGLVQFGLRFAHVAGGCFQERLAQHHHHGGQPVLFLGVLPEGVQAHGLDGFSQLVQVGVQRVEERGEIGAGAFFGPFQVGQQAFLFCAGQDIGPDLVLDGAFFLREPLVQQVVQLGQSLVQAGRAQWRGLVADGDGAATAAGLGGLTDVVDDVGVDDRDVADGQHRRIVDGQAAFLAGQPFLGAVGAEVDQGVMRSTLADPQVGGQVGVRGQGVGAGGVVEGLLAVDVAIGAGFGAAGLRQDGQLAQLQTRDGKDRLTLPVDDAEGTRRIPPAGQQGLAGGFGQGVQPLAVACQR